MKIKHLVLVALLWLSPVLALAQSTWFPAGSPTRLQPAVSTWGLKVPGIAGVATYCVQVDNTGIVSNTGAACGGSGSTPGGADTNVQFNDAGTFGGSSGLSFTKGNSLLTGLSSLFTFSTTTNFLATGSSTLQNFTFINATGTSATTTNLFSTKASTTALYLGTGNGLLINTAGLISAIAGTTCTNQFLRAFTSSGGTCATIGSADVTLANLTAGNSSLTFSGTYDGSTARTIVLNVGNANTWSALQTFSNADSLLATGSTTLQNFTGLNSTTTNATTTTLFTTTASTTNLYLSVGTGCLTLTAGRVTSTGSACGSGGGSNTDKFATSTGSFLSIYPNTSTNVGLGIGTTTPAWAVQIASSTRPQLTLSDGSLTSNHWSFRNAGGNFYLATSSPSTFATSTTAGMTIDLNGNVAFPLTVTAAAHILSGAVTTPPVTGMYAGVASGLDWSTNSLWRAGIDVAGRFGIGSSTPQWLLQLATSTRSQLTLSTGVATDDHLSFRFTGSTFYIASSSASTFATSTTPLLIVDENQPASFSLGSTTPPATLNSLTIGSNGANGSTTVYMGKLQWDGYNSAGVRYCSFINIAGAMTTQTGACTP